MATEVHVGGRLEAVAPRRVTDSGDRLRLLALLAVGVLVHVWVVAHTSVTARDSIGFARIALQLENPRASGLHDLTEVLKTAHHPPGYPLAVLAASEVVRPAYPAPLPDQMLLSAQVASAIAGVLLLFPTYWLGRMLFGKFAGFAAALLVEVLPVPAEHTSDGLTEGLYLLGLGTALVLGVRAVRKPGVGGFLLCGLAIGATYLVRPEGILPAVAVGTVAVGMALARRWPWSLTAGRLAALGVGVLITSLPYMVLIGGVTNKPTGAGILPGFLSPKQLLHEPHSAVTSPALFADWYVPETDGPRYAWVPKAMAQESAKAFHYAPALLALVGLAVAARRLRAEPSLWVLILFAGMMLAVLTVLAYVGQRNPADAEAERRSYLSDRHTLSVVYVGLIFAGAGLVQLPTLLGRLPGVGRWLGRPVVAPIVLALIVISCVPPLLKSLHKSRAGHAEAGRYLAAHLGESDNLIDPFEWAQFYAGRTVRQVIDDNPYATTIYAVQEGAKSENPHSRLPRMHDAQNVAHDGRAKVVFRWPENAPEGREKVVVYRLQVEPLTAAATIGGTAVLPVAHK